jgi:hypothetical protein
VPKHKEILMGSCNDDIGQTLPQRLLAHAELHQELIEFDYCEQRRWADDLREAAAELVRLQSEATKSERRAITFGDLMTRQAIAMQAALIEQSTGRGDDAALEWIANTLEGPGLLPDLSEAAHLPKTAIDGPAQAWFDAKMAEHEAFRAAHPAP